jgi:hypothetical protein
MDFPIAEIILPHRDEAAELDDATDAVTYTDARYDQIMFIYTHLIDLVW